MALINVTWTAAEVDENGMVTVSYDCFYPIESDDTWIEVTVYPIPYMYKDQAYIRKAFQTPHHKQTLKKEQHTTTNESDVNPDGNVSTVKNVPETTRGPVLDITPMQVIQKSTTMTVVIVILSIFSVAFVCLGVLLGVFYKCHQPWRIHKDPIQVFLVFGEDSVKHQKKCRSLGTYLARTVPCRVRYMSDYATELALGTAVNSAHFILVVTSETVTNALHDEAPGTHLAACMQLVRNQLSKNIMLFFGRTKPSDGFRWLSDKEPISVDTALEDLKKYLRGTDDSLKDIGDSASATHSVVEHPSVSQLLTPFRDTQFLVPEQPSAFRSREVQGQHSLSHNVRGPISYPDPVCSSQTGSNFVSRCGSLVQSVNESVVT